MPDTANISGGVSINSGQTSIGGDAVGRDKIIQAPDPLAQYLHQLPRRRATSWDAGPSSKTG
jgi:hypothetical protein